MIQFDDHIFGMGDINHQLEKLAAPAAKTKLVHVRPKTLGLVAAHGIGL